MRVISGIYGGRNLAAPAGQNTRPTTDRVKESLFSTLASARGGFSDAVVLDAFAGSGALGIEALSRGAAFALFCERDRAALTALAKNTSFLDEGSFRIVRGDCLKRVAVLADAPHAFDLVLLDPPYALSPTAVAGFVADLDSAGALSPECLVTYECASGALAEEALLEVGWCARGVKIYGDTKICLFAQGR